MPRKIDLGYIPRKQFIPFHRRKARFACLVCHRGSGKTYATMADLVDACISNPGGRYIYIAPFRLQAKGISWDHGKKLCAQLGTDRFVINEAELRIDFWNGSRLRLYGADNPDSLRGVHPNGVVLDEAADMDSRLWPEVVLPALAVHKGWAVFIGTPRGHNFFYNIHKQALENPDQWFHMMLKASESGILPPEALENLRNSITPEQYDQEMEASFEAAVLGTYYAKDIEAARTAGRITSVPYDPAIDVQTAWDLGYTDSTAIVFAQVVGKEVHIIDYLEASGKPLGHYVRELRDRPYVYGSHLLPFDAEAHEVGTGRSRIETLHSLALYGTRLVTHHQIPDGINAARMLIPRCYFDKERTERLTDALTLYRADVDPRFVDPQTKRPMLKRHAVHDWTSHPADAFRYLAMGIDDKNFGPRFYRPIDYPRLGIV